MSLGSWDKTAIKRENGELVEAQAPVIVSASRSTDIPTYYPDWFFHRLKVGYSAWTNPFNNKKLFIDYSKTRFIVFWSKQPRPMLEYIKRGELKDKGIDCYLQYTLNDYEDCGLNFKAAGYPKIGSEKILTGLESNLAPLESRIDTFIEYSELLGKERIIWRFDPLFLLDRMDVDDLLERIERIGDRLHPYTNRFVFSFADVESIYSNVERNLKTLGVPYKEWTLEKMHQMAAGIARLNEKWGLMAATCGEKADLSAYGIAHSHCIDEDLIIQLAHNDDALMKHLKVQIIHRQDSLLGDDLGLSEGQIDLGGGLIAQKHIPASTRRKIPISDGTRLNWTVYKDKGQRQACGCTYAKDIGEYGTCLHFCHYCYANGCMKWESLLKNWRRHKADPFGESIN